MLNANNPSHSDVIHDASISIDNDDPSEPDLNEYSCDDNVREICLNFFYIYSSCMI